MKRRTFLKYACASTGALAVGSGTFGYCKSYSEKIKTKARIVVVGAGAGGLTTAAKLAQRLDGAQITIVDEKEKHCYQPGLTLVGCGVYKPDDIVGDNIDYIPTNVNWIREMVAEYNPDSYSITTERGRNIPYDFLVVATGLQLNYSQIYGLDEKMIGQNGIGSVYHSPEKAELTWLEVQRFIITGGVGLFTNPSGRIKCAGAPIKAAFLAESLAREAGKRKAFKLSYLTAFEELFFVQEIKEMCLKRFKEKKILPHYKHELSAIDANRKVALFRTDNGSKEYSYDYIHIVPPMSAPESVKNSPLSWKRGKYSKAGWLAVDKFSLQHLEYDNVFGVGDIIGTPVGKSGASVKRQAPVVAENITRMIRGDGLPSLYNGYTSCPFITGIGCAAIIEFDYSKQLTPSLPIFDPNDDGPLGWNLKLYVIKPMYFQMLQGRVPG